MAKELPDGLGDRVLIGLGAGSWRGDTPEEEEFFRIIDSKCSRNGSSVRKGTGPLCDLGSVSGKGSRPENLGSIASKVSLGRKRSINMDGEYVEQESREGSRKGGNPVVLYDISPSKLTPIPGGAILNDNGKTYKIEDMPKFEPHEWINKLVIWPMNRDGWDYIYDYCDWQG
jgi:hypothetical protein